MAEILRYRLSVQLFAVGEGDVAAQRKAQRFAVRADLIALRQPGHKAAVGAARQQRFPEITQGDFRFVLAVELRVKGGRFGLDADRQTAAAARRVSGQQR